MDPGVAEEVAILLGDLIFKAETARGFIFNLANALGPWLGGMAITAGYGWTSTGYIGAATALVGLGIYLIARRMKGGH